MPNFTVRNRGTDSSGRAILMTDYMADWWEQVVADLGFRPVITQGAWMARVPGGGAENSQGYHDGGGCLDLRTWDRTPAQREQMVRVIRLNGAAGYRRYTWQGMDEDHFHLTLGTDHGLTSGARFQWSEYIAGRDGLASRGKDYEWRPSPLVLTPPKKEWDEMASKDEIREVFREEFATFKAAERSRYQRLREVLKKRFKATDADLDAIQAELDKDKS